MNYIHRAIENKVLSLSKQYPVVLLCGARQVGKSTMLHHIKEANRRYVSLDDIKARALAVQDPELFIQTYGYPVLIDEIQRAPMLLTAIKQVIDTLSLEGQDNSGLFWMTGSQQFQMMKDVSESLAGRVAVIHLAGLSMRECSCAPTSVFTADIESLKIRAKSGKGKDLHGVYEAIFRGGMPKLITEKMDREDYFSNYVTTYLERDVRDLSQVGNLLSFQNLLAFLAARTGQELNYSDAASALGVSAPTVKNWISILEASGIIFLLKPYSNNLTKRLIKSPKLYFMDTGLCAYLAKWPSAEVLEAGAMSGAYLENFVVCEIIKSYYGDGKKPDFYFYRDIDQKEIDLLFEVGDALSPVEIKKSAYPSGADKQFSTMQKYKHKINTGIILCLSDDMIPLNRNAWMYPISKI